MKTPRLNLLATPPSRGEGIGKLSNLPLHKDVAPTELGFHNLPFYKDVAPTELGYRAYARFLCALGLTVAGLVSSNFTARAQTGNHIPPPGQIVSNNEVDFDALLKKAAAQPPAPFEGAGWRSLFDGHSLKGWAVTDFAGHGGVQCEEGLILIDLGDSLSGVNYTNGNLPNMNYEVALDAMKLAGSDFFCGLTFPVGNTNCSLILGGWGGGTVGISSIDGDDASENETSSVMKFDTNRWYRVRVRVTEGRIESWLDDKKIVDVKTEGRRIGLRFGEIELSRPLGVATYQTTAAVREIKVRTLKREQNIER